MSAKSNLRQFVASLSGCFMLEDKAKMSPLGLIRTRTYRRRTCSYWRRTRCRGNRPRPRLLHRCYWASRTGSFPRGASGPGSAAAEGAPGPGGCPRCPLAELAAAAAAAAAVTEGDAGLENSLPGSRRNGNTFMASSLCLYWVNFPSDDASQKKPMFLHGALIWLDDSSSGCDETHADSKSWTKCGTFIKSTGCVGKNTTKYVDVYVPDSLAHPCGWAADPCHRRRAASAADGGPVHPYRADLQNKRIVLVKNSRNQKRSN